MHEASRKSNKPRTVNLNYRALRQAGVMVFVYVLLLLILPTSRSALHSYRMSMFEYHVISFAVALPSLLVWLGAFVGYAALHQYAQSLLNAPEAKHFERLAIGCEWLAWALPITAIVSLVLNSLVYKWPGFHATSIIITNYVNLLLPLVAFSIIGVASRGLISNAGIKFSLAGARAIILLFLAAGVMYCYLTFFHFDLSNIRSTNNPYYLPVWLMVITVIIPYLYAWFIGILAAYEITMLSKQTRGLIYKRALQLLAGGLVTIIISLIALQYINSVRPRVGYLVFGYILVANVIFRVAGGIGFILLTIGAFKLKRIEEV